MITFCRECFPEYYTPRPKRASNSVSTITVTAAQVAAAKVMVKRRATRGERPTDALIAIANATKAPAPKKASNMIHARELDITPVTTVSELFELIALPYRITKHAQLSIVSTSEYTPVRTLRLEWRGEPE